ncbi:hypothetical protein [Halomonas cupida]|uniref:hypothetical protein n=1 Tax=Halomonas cupida TaxID=44933 RepID=UPI003A932716
MKRVLIAAGLLALTGCAAQDHYYSQGVCVTCINNPLTGEPVNYDPNETPQRVATNAQGETVDVSNLGSQRGSVDIDSPVDVDTAYARIKSSMGFRSPNDFESPESTTAKMGYPDYLVGMRERKVADKLNPQRISWLMARSVRSLAREQILHQTGDAQDQQQ